MTKYKTDHIDKALPENMKGLAKQYYVRARKAEAERDELQNKIRSLESDLANLRGSVYDMVSVFEE